MPETNDLVFVGTLVHSTKTKSLEVLTDTAIAVRNGKIIFVTSKDQLSTVLEKYQISQDDVIYLKQKFLMPGFVDSHAHAPQFSFVGTGSGLELLPWLQTYTYPTETRFLSDDQFASDVYNKCVNRTLRNGTTTVCYFATIDRRSTMTLVDAVARQGQRAFIGKVNMDTNSPDSYRESRDQSVSDTRRFIKDVLDKKNPLITPCITPRFAVTCSMELMKQLGHLATEFSLPVQTHISENVGEIELVSQLFPDTRSYTEVYDRAGLLGSKTILAHGVHLSRDELRLIKDRDSGISHCPNSNISLCSGILDVRKALDVGVKVGLGTDFAGGHSPSMLDAIRRGAESANILKQQTLLKEESVTPLTYMDMFRLATLGSSEVLGLDDVIGNFSVGKEFDAIVVNAYVKGGPFDVFVTDNIDDVIQKFIFLGDDRNIEEVYVAGRKVLAHTE
ncbi:guanine deaminase-like [Physella acuta]|uniref:guanine deaminase-like n=1 Tax=Physella acuta TaxID=109671 RepID=UPI0027DC91C3|nr:guanine deaminase-like [Physella acuta]